MMQSRTGEQLFREVIKVNNESDIQTRLHNVLSRITRHEWHTERSYGKGPIDLLCPALKIVIECKGRGFANPNSPGHRNNETQKGQLERYLSSASMPLDNRPWLGFLTDGVSWWGYDWNSHEEKAIPLTNYPSKTEINSYSKLKDFMEKTLELKQDRWSICKTEPPDNLGQILFYPLTKDIEHIQKKMESKKGFRTKLLLWENVLHGSGITPPTPLRKHEVFGLHSLLVITSRLLIGILNNEKDINILLTNSGDGFQGWLLETDESRELIEENLYKELLKYDWCGTTRDVLKSVYHSLIDKEHRKEFGEYYTPDDLALMVVEEVLDDDWCDNAIKRVVDILDNPDKEVNYSHLGVLDPSCGSGTFLFHSAIHIYRRINRKHKHELHRAPEIIARLVHGIDVHPVAVEMAKATLSMALKNSKDLHLRVMLGDAMQSEEEGELMSPIGVSINSPGNKSFIFPREIITHKQANKIIEHVVSAAIEENETMIEQVSSLVKKPLVRKLYDNMVTVIRDEGNHVWKWHLLNVAASANLKRHGVDRIVGNPPWLVANDTPEGRRKYLIERMREEEYVKPKLRSSAKGDLASVFTARVTGLYASREKTRYGWILPGSAIINQTWSKWRAGTWRHANVIHEVAWGLDDIEPPVFPHSPNGTCVFIGQTTLHPPPPTKNDCANLERFSGCPNYI